MSTAWWIIICTTCGCGLGVIAGWNVAKWWYKGVVCQPMVTTLMEAVYEHGGQEALNVVEGKINELK